jgi:hypothetical protein
MLNPPFPDDLKVGETFQMTVLVSPQNASENAIWWSDNPLVATISSTGLLKAVATGTTEIGGGSMEWIGTSGMFRIMTVTEGTPSVQVSSQPSAGDKGKFTIICKKPTSTSSLIASAKIEIPSGDISLGSPSVSQVIQGLAKEVTGAIVTLVKNGTEYMLGIDLSDVDLVTVRAASGDEETIAITVPYTAASQLPEGDYTIVVNDFIADFDDGSSIRKTGIPVTISVDHSGVGIREIIETQSDVVLFIRDNRLYVNSPAVERITVYSMTGMLVRQMEKSAGEATFDIGNLPRGVLIVRGSSGWTRKIVK